MAPPKPAVLKTAVYHCPINASSDPTPLKPPSQKTQYIAQVPRSPSVSQRFRPSTASQTHSDDFVQDSLEQHPSAPARQPSTFLDFLKQSGPVENSQSADTLCEKDPIASRLQSQSQAVAQGSIEGLSPKYLPSGNHTIEDSIQVPPPTYLPSQGNTVDITDGTERRTPSQTQAITEHLTRAHTHVYTDPDDDDDDDEEILDCITVRPRPATPPAELSVRKGTNSSASVSSASRRSEDIYSVTPLNRAGFLHPDISATTAYTTPSMPHKTSTTKGTTSASQGRKAASTASKKSSKPAPPLPDIVNEGETSSIAILRNMRAGGTSQANTTREASKTMPKVVSGTETSQKSSVRPIQAPTNKPATKSAQQRQSRPPVPSTKRLSRGAELPEGRDEFGYSPDPVASKRPAVPWHPEDEKVKSTKTTKPRGASLSLSKKSSKSQPEKKAAKASESDEDDDDEEYSAPKTYKSKTTITTRASTRAQTQTITENDGPNVSTRKTTASNTTRKELSMSRKTAPSHREEIEDFEDSVTHINSGGAASPQPTTLSSPAKPTATKQKKPRRATEKEAQLMRDAISSPDHTTTPAATKPQLSKKAPFPRASYSAAHELIPEQGTTQRNPVNIDDDGSNEDDENAMHEYLDASYDEIITEVMGQEPQDKPKISPTKDQAQSRVVVAHVIPMQQSLGQTTDPHPDLNLVAQERAQRKPNIVGFDANGPRNQGARHQGKLPELGIHEPPLEKASSPDVDQFGIQGPSPTFFTTSGPNTRPKGVLNFEAPEVPAHNNAVAPLLATTSGDVATLKPKYNNSNQLRKTVVAVEVSTAKGMRSTESELSAEAITIGHRGTNAQLVKLPTRNTSYHDRQSIPELRAQSGLVEEYSQELTKESVKYDGKLHRDADTTRSPEPRVKHKTPSNSDGSRDAISVDPMQPIPRKHVQTLSDQSVPQPRAQIVQPQGFDRPSKTSGSKASTAPAEHNQESMTRKWSQSSQTTPPAVDRKRPSVGVDGEAAKRLKSGNHGSRMQPTQVAAAKASISRKLSQVDDNGSPMPYGGEMSQGTAVVPQTRQTSITTGSTLTNFATHQTTDEPFARPTALARNELAKPEMRALKKDSPPQVSQPITHADFDRDTQLTAGYLQTLGLHKDAPKHVSPVPLQSSPRRAAPIQESLSLLEALRSEMVQRTDAPGANENDGEESAEPEKPMDEDDPDKTLVNEDSDDGDDSDDDGSGSRNSSDTDGDEVAKSALSIWRDALASHQGDVYDQLVRIAHRLTNHLKDHETAIKDVNTDYSQDGMRLIQRLVKDNETKLEHYRTKKSKIQQAMVFGCEQAYDSLYKDMKDVKASRERIVKTLQKQVNAVRRLDQILQTYQA